MVGMSAPASTIEDAVQAALATVDDPEIRRPITELGMVKGFTVADGRVRVELLLTVSGCPLRDKLNADITAALTRLPGIIAVEVDFGVMTEEQRKALQTSLRGGSAAAEPVIPFAQPGSRTGCTRWPAARAGSASRVSRSTWPPHSPSVACRSAWSTRTSTGIPYPGC